MAGRVTAESCVYRYGHDVHLFMNLGTVHCTIGTPYVTVLPILEQWRAAAIHARRLPSQVSPEIMSQADETTWNLAYVLRLDGIPTRVTTLMAARPSTRTPAYLLVKVGPLICEVLDQAAWESMTRVWETAHDELHR